MRTAIVTGSSGLIGSETVKCLLRDGHRVIGIDNDMRAYFFGEEATTRGTTAELSELSENFISHAIDIRDFEKLSRLFEEH